ncbi:hypothetical protein H9P43_001604 [Blastocladiella emersonii ATCC 22665]|nr:hypothetical protein H9P43_001604 [Blastocladiella emersonii ATCC 22665]
MSAPHASPASGTADPPATAAQPKFVIQPGTALAAAGVAFAVGLGASWLLARRGKLPNPGAVEAMIEQRASPSSPGAGAAVASRISSAAAAMAPATPTSAPPAAAATRRIQTNRIGGRVQPAGTMSPAAAAAAIEQAQQRPSAKDAMKLGFRAALDITGSDDVPRSSAAAAGGKAAGPPDAADMVYAAKAFGIGTALALSLFGVGTWATMKALGVSDIAGFHLRMREVLGLRVLAINESLKPHTEFLRVPEPDNAEADDAAAFATLERAWDNEEADVDGQDGAAEIVAA